MLSCDVGLHHSRWLLSAFVAVTLGSACTRGSRGARAIDESAKCSELPSDSGGRRDKKAIQRKVREHQAKFEACYDRALARDKAAAGRVETRFVIESDGSVSSACIHSATLEDGEFVDCMLDEFRDIRFGPANGKVTVVYPLSFSPG